MSDDRTESTDRAPTHDRRLAPDGGETGDEPDDAGPDRPTETAADPSARPGPQTAEADGDGMSTTRKYVYWITLGMALLVGFVFVIVFYTNVQAVIDEWIAHRYRLLFSTAFNLAMVLAAGIVVSLLLRRLETDET